MAWRTPMAAWIPVHHLILLLVSLDLVYSLCVPKSRRPAEKSKLYVASGDVYLLSLQWPDETFSKPVKDLWRWKDSVLGDGRDYFVPKSKTLTALNRHLVWTCDSVDECSVLSNCARFELLLWSPETSDVVRDQVSKVLAAQVQAHQRRPFSVLQDQIARFDSPQSIDANAPPCDGEIIVSDIRTSWKCLSGVERVCDHLCLVAAGMASRPNRPDRPVPFRPFSSRDAHILLQLKRTPTEGNRIKLLLDAALAAGKAARDPQRVPELQSLRDYGSGDNKYSMDPPAEITDSAARAAVCRAIEPTVKDYVERWNAMRMSDLISRLRLETESLSQTDAELLWLRTHLHKPTMDLRQGKILDIEAAVAELDMKLRLRRQGLLE
jgi:hypothetical protein